jgi:hypothetical protein
MRSACTPYKWLAASLRYSWLLRANEVVPLGAAIFSGTLAAGVTGNGAGVGVGLTGAVGVLQPLIKAKAVALRVNKL